MSCSKQLYKGRNMWQPQNFFEPSQDLRKPSLALYLREAVFLGRLRASLATARLSPGLLLQYSQKFVLPLFLPQQSCYSAPHCLCIDTLSISTDHHYFLMHFLNNSH